jgi:hypothetical protein
MYFRDLTPYTYGSTPPVDSIVNIGWLSREHGFATGLAPREFLTALARLTDSPVNLYRGRHYCEFCPTPMVTMSDRGPTLVEPPSAIWGNREIRVPADCGRIYVAPKLVLHYVEAHGYLPPEEFMNACVAHARALNDA